MRSLEEDSRLRRVVDRVPRPVRLAAMAVVGGVVVYDRFVIGPDGPSPGWVLAIESAGVVVLGAFGLVLLAHTFNAPDRRPLDDDGRFWLAYLMTTGSLIGVPVWGFFAGDPAKDPLIGVAMVVVGLVLAGLGVRHVRKPVRADARPRSTYDNLFRLRPPAEPPPPGPQSSDAARWSDAARRANRHR